MPLSKLPASTAAGVYRFAVLPGGIPPAIGQGTSRAALIEVSKVRDKLAFLAALSEPLGFPEHLAQNWDSFYECLNGLAHRSAGELALVFDDLSGFARSEPEEFDAGVDALRDAVDYWSERGQRLTVLIGLDQASLAPDVPALNGE